MIVAIPVDENQTDVCVSFGRAPYVLFHHTETGETEVKKNPAAAEEGGAGIKSAQFIVDQGTHALITIRCGENAAEVLRAADITIYKAEGDLASENLAAIQEGKLSLLTSFHAGFLGKQ